MITSVLYESTFSNRFIELDGFNCGILLGGPLENEEYLFLPIELPPKENVDDDVQNHLELPLCIADIDGQWVASHCRNLVRMIPGGVRISGICVTASVSEFSAAQDHLKKVLCQLPKPHPIVNEIISQQENEKILLLIDPQTKSFTCKLIDVSSPGAIFRPVPIKQRGLLSRYKAFKTHINLSLETILPTDRKKEEILLQLQAAVAPYLQSLLTDANLLLNGEFHKRTDQVLPDEFDLDTVGTPSSNKHKKSSRTHKRRSAGNTLSGDYDNHGELEDYLADKHASQEPCSEKGSWADVELTIFGPQFPRWQRASSSSSLESGTSSDTGYTGGTDGTESLSDGFVPINRLMVNGRIPGIAFLPSNTTVEKLFQALRTDLIQSILARLELLTDELHITSAELEVPRMLLPQRVLVRLPACPTLPLSDYKFLSETADDVVARLHYFCVPMGVQRSGLSRRRPSSADSGISVDATIQGLSNSASANLVDASCLDTSLEKSPGNNADAEYSETELMENVAQTVQPVTKYMSFSNPVFLLVTTVMLVVGVLLSSSIIGSWNKSS